MRARVAGDYRREMEYRRLGRAGLKVSVLSFGSWVTFGPQIDVGVARRCSDTAYDARRELLRQRRGVRRRGVRADHGQGDRVARLAAALLRRVDEGLLGHQRPASNMREHAQPQVPHAGRSTARSSVSASTSSTCLFCHRSDPNTPIEETVWAMSDIVAAGKALYWGTSEWTADEIRAAWEIAERHHLRKPVMEQPQYNLFERDRVEREYARLYEDIGLGRTIWSPLASGLLTGQVHGRRSRTTAAPHSRATSGSADSMTSERSERNGPAAQGRSPTSSGAPSVSCPSRGARRTRTSRR